MKRIGNIIFTNTINLLRTVDYHHITISILCILVAMPLIALIVLAGNNFDIAIWSHLLEFVFVDYIINTLSLIFGVGCISLIFGISTAWVVSRYNFFGRKIFEWVLLLPAAIPAYIVAYSYTDFFEYSGIFQKTLRHIFDWHSPDDYYFPEIRSHAGAILVMASVLYPYIYLLARTAFRATKLSLYDVTKLHNGYQFWHVALPLSRPAIVAGLALISMEVMADFGTVDYFAIETISLAVYNIWFGFDSLPAATQVAFFGVGLILMLLWIEHRARYHQHYHDSWQDKNKLSQILCDTVSIKQQIICWIICLIPIFLGFILPVAILISLLFDHNAWTDYQRIFNAAKDSLSIAFVACFCILFVSFLLVIIQHYKPHRYVNMIINFTIIGYGFPGTILAIGVLTAVAWFDNIISFVLGESKAIIAGSIAVLIIAYTIRFLAIGHGALLHMLRRLSPNILNAGEVLGYGFNHNAIYIILPLLKKAMITGGLLIFVDTMKELPMSLLLRPFGIDSLAVAVYQYAGEEMLDKAAIPALMIVIFGLLPIIFMNRLVR